MTLLGASVVLPVAFVAYAIEEVPLTGRLRLNVIPYELDVAIGHHAFQEFLEMNSDLVLPKDNFVSETVQAIGDAIVASSGIELLQNLNWEYAVVDTGDVNAMVLMGGNVIFFTGMVNLAETSDNVAVVLSHEIAHVLARHTAEQLTTTSSLIAVNLFLGSLLGFGVPEIAAELLVRLPNSRKNESEADFIGMLLLARAGLDPRLAPAFWRKMIEAEDSMSDDALVYISTHPSHTTRVQQLEEWMPIAMAEFHRCHGRFPDGYEPPPVVGPAQQKIAIE